MTLATLELELDWPYDDALAAMRAARDAVVAGGPMKLFVGSHREEVVTLGRHAPESQLVMRAALDARGVLVRRIERGGGATAHGPGQLVVYPVIHLPTVGLDVPGLTRALLDGAADLARELGISADVNDAAGDAGLYVEGRKLASVGFRVEQGVVTHGLAINVENDLSLFGLIAPCGRMEQPMTSFVALKNGATSWTLADLATSLGFHVARRCVLALESTRPGGEMVSTRRLAGTGANA
jgi:lipoic acid synthetase/lipoyl(octanoyl) transferase